MAERDLGFPINPKEQIDSAAKQYGVNSVDFTWQVLLAASAQADKRMSKSVPVDSQGMHTAIVNELMEPYLGSTIEPASMENFRPYFDGKVWPRWRERKDNNVELGKKRHFIYKAWQETVSQAELEPDVYLLFANGVNRMESQSYLHELTEGVKSLAPDDDFPYRGMKTEWEVRRFWSYLITGNQTRPGALKAAASLEQQTNTVNSLLRKVFGGNTDMVLANQMLDLVLHVQSSKRHSGETARSILTPLMQAFNSRNLGEVRQSLAEFAVERRELVAPGFDRFLEIDRQAMASERRRTEAINIDAKKTKLHSDFAELKQLVESSERSVRCRFSYSMCNPATNRYVENNRWRTYLLNYPGHRHESVVLLEVADRMNMDSGTKVYGTVPTLEFLKLEETRDGRETKVVGRRIGGKKFFKEVRQKQGQVVEKDIDVEYLKQIAVAWGDMDERTPLLLDFIESLENPAS